jgi:hypothetical protein
MIWHLIIGIVIAMGAAIRGNWSPCGESLQAQLHPMGESGRGNRWGVTIGFFALGSAMAGGFLGALAAALGSLALGGESASLWYTGLIAVAAGALDLSRLRPPTPRRQVNENWINRYRGWVYGAAFGIQLGLGFTVFVMSWGYYAMLIAAFLSASPLAGALVGVVFGLSRGLLLYLSKGVNTPAKLARFHRTMAARRQLAFALTGSATFAIGLIAVVAVL